MTSVRPAAVAGMFYPDDRRQLEAEVQFHLTQVHGADGPVPKAIIAPHAGYVYSGPVAASAYARIAPARDRIRRVVLLGPCHRVAVRGLAASGADAFDTPLGPVPLDKDAIASILDLPQVQVYDATHAQEHSLEVHLPFLQEVLESFALVPLVVGDASADQVADVLERLWGGPETLIVVSSDLSHYLDYDSARRMDAATCQAIETLDPSRLGRDQACGRVPVGGLLTLARRRGLQVATVDLRNSGDTAGGRDRVVGYGSWVFVEPAAEGAGETADEEETPGEEAFVAQTRSLLERHGTTLLHLAAASVRYGLDNGQPLPVDSGQQTDDLRGLGACFVTLKKGGKLRGCIGSPQAYRALAVDVAENAYSAAFGDRRFPRLEPRELEDLSLSISVLSAASPMRFTDQADLLAQLRPGIDGLIIEDSGSRALFLPAVWEGLPKKEKFLSQLKVKAGLAADHWSPDFKAWRFVAEEVSGDDLDDPSALWA